MSEQDEQVEETKPMIEVETSYIDLTGAELRLLEAISREQEAVRQKDLYAVACAEQYVEFMKVMKMCEILSGRLEGYEVFDLGEIEKLAEKELAAETERETVDA